LHSIATSAWFQADAEWDANIESGFGATIAVSHPAFCGGKTKEAAALVNFYYQALEYFEFYNFDEYDVDTCDMTEDISSGYPENFFMVTYQYFDSAQSCFLVDTPTEFSIYSRDGYYNCRSQLEEDGVFTEMDADENQQVSQTESEDYGMPAECFAMYTQVESYIQDSSVDYFTIDSYQGLQYVRDDFNLLRGKDYEITRNELSAYDISSYSDLYFDMFDTDVSKEVSWPEFCAGMTRVNDPILANGNEDWYGMTVEEFTALGVNDATQVNFFDMNADGFVEEYEWIVAQTQLNEFFSYLAPDASEVDTSALTADDFTVEEIAFWDSNNDNFVSMDEFVSGMELINAFEELSPEGVYYLDNANEEAEFDASFDVNMDNMIDSDEHIQGQTWLKTWNSTYEDGSGFAAIADFTDFTSDEVSAMDANFDQQIDVLEFLTFNSYKAYWNMNIYDNITFTEDIALEGTYRNWADYSIEGYTSDMFSAMDTDQSGDVSYDEYVQWLTVQNTYLYEIAQSHYPLDYELQTVCEEDSNYDLISKTAREFADQDFDGVVSWEEYVISQIQVQQFANAQVDGVIAATDFTTAENYTEGQMTLLDYNQDGEVTLDEWYVYMIATRVWSELTNVTQAEIFT